MGSWLDSIIDGTGSVSDWVSDKLDSAKDTVSSGYKTVIQYKDNFFGHLDSELSKVKGYFGQGAEGISSSMSDAWHRSVDAVQKPDGVINTAISKAQGMANVAMENVENLAIPDMVKALTNWTVGFIMGFFTGMMDLIKYIIELGTSRVQGFFNIISTGMVKVGTFLGGIPKYIFSGLWGFVSNLTEGTGAFAPILSVLLIVVPIVLLLMFARWLPGWLTERGYELL